jgi:hypothetical protein
MIGAPTSRCPTVRQLDPRLEVAEEAHSPH